MPVPQVDLPRGQVQVTQAVAAGAGPTGGFGSAGDDDERSMVGVFALLLLTFRGRRKRAK